MYPFLSKKYHTMSKTLIWVSKFIAEQYSLNNIKVVNETLLLVEVNDVDLVKLDNDNISYTLHPIEMNIGEIE